MPRPRKPTRLHELSGAFAHDPKRKQARANEPQPAGDLGPAPKHLAVGEKRIWRELAAMAPAGVLFDSDRWAVEIACHLMAKLRSGDIKPQESSILLSTLSRLGLTPADRSKIQAAPRQPADPFETFMNDLISDDKPEAEPIRAVHK